MYVAIYPESPSQGLTTAVLSAGYQPVPVADVADAGRKEPPNGWHAVLVELGDLPDLALTIATKMQEELSIPAVLVVDRTATEGLIDAAGYHDFVLTPIDHAELKVRLHRLGVVSEPATEEILLRYEDLELNTATYQATIAGSPRDLTYMEYELLRFFVENPGRVWSREQILSKVWGYDYFGGSRTVDVHVRRLRAKLGEERSSWITTVRSVGYRFG